MHTNIETKCVVSIDTLLKDLKCQAHGAKFTPMDIAILKDILRIARNSEPAESPATDRQQRQCEISALRDLVQLIDDSVKWGGVNLSEIGADKLNRAKDVLKLHT
jgi:hypothetical protein